MKKCVFLFLVFTGLILPSICKSQAEFGEGSGRYGVLLNDLKSNLYEKSRIKTVTLDGEERRMFISWVRDHIHAMKAYKYWEKDLSSYIAFFMGHQTGTGMYFDYWMSYKNENVGQLYFTNCFDNEFYFVDVNNQNFFFRMPIEADLEYLLVEGVYQCWQTSGDTAYVKKWLPTLVKGMQYEMSDPLRWSKEFQVVKRPYSIDTWDFTSEPDSLKGVERLLYHIGNTPETPKGIMHGDNSGMFQACIQLSAMFGAIGKTDAAKEWQLQGELFRHRLNTICWNGRHYTHFIPIQPVPGHIKTDPINALGLSNTYSVNRGAPTSGMAYSIIEAYKKVWQEVKAFSKAEWFGIYPFIEPHFGKYKVGEYMNGAILPLVGGELAKAAFQNGQERYAIEILERLDKIMDINNRKLPGCINWDGTEQREAVPNEWGQAAFVSALVEGLAGVVDKGIKFNTVEISPRWYFADVNQTFVKVGYGNNGSQVSYQYNFNPNTKKLILNTEGKFDNFVVRIPFPGEAKSAFVLINNKKVPVGTEDVNGSKYAVIKGNGSKNSIHVQFRQ
jgi:hypothetical protein